MKQATGENPCFLPSQDGHFEPESQQHREDDTMTAKVTHVQVLQH